MLLPQGLIYDLVALDAARTRKWVQLHEGNQRALLDASRTRQGAEITLFVRLYKIRKHKFLLSLGQPFTKIDQNQ